MKRGIKVLLILLILVLSLNCVVGQEEEIGKQMVDGGMTPDNFFYFVDQFFDLFGDDLEIREEKLSEVKVMLERKNIGAAKISLEEYYEYASDLEKEVSPEERERVLESAELIKREVKKLEKDVPLESKEEFVDKVIIKESSIVTAVEIADKINKLCKELSELDPVQYYDVCKTDVDSPEWQKDLHEDLTEKQIEEAENFGMIMSECFKTSGEKCNCEDIPFPEFTKTCLKARPLVVACETESNEVACEKLDGLDIPKLPKHLQNVFDDLESGFKEDKFGLYMPKECADAGATSSKECGKIMTLMHAPEECKEALLAANPNTEREGRELCDKIMMEMHSPECVDEGITDIDECQDYMYNIDRRPKECAEQGIHDLRDCKEFLESGGDKKGSGFHVGVDCKSIENSMERLDCYDNAASQVSSYGGYDEENYEGPCLTDDDWKIKKAECREKYGKHAGDEPIMGDSGKGYECAIDIKCIDFGQFKDEENSGEDYEESECKDGCSDECPGASRTDCVGEKCKCYYEDDSSDDNSDSEEGSDGGEESGENDDLNEIESEADDETSDVEEEHLDEEINVVEEDDSSSESSDDDSDSDGGSDEEGSNEESSDSGGNEITGGAVSFWNYFL